MNNIRIWTFLAIVSGYICQGYRILVISPVPSGSHAILGDATVKSLLDAHHEVVYVTALPKRLEPHRSLEIVDVSSHKNNFLGNIVNLTNILDNRVKKLGIVFFLEHLSIFSAKIVEHEAVRKVLNDGTKFDAVIAEWMFSELYAGIPALLDCPLIWFSSVEPHGMILKLMHEDLNPAYSPSIGVESVVPFTFVERVEQLWDRIYLTVYREFYYILFKETTEFNKLFGPMMEKVGKRLPSYQELRYNASLVLSNSHVSLGQPTSLPPNFISIGGYHVDPEVKPLAVDLKKIMDNAKHGVIYFSMGSILKSRDFPPRMKKDLLNMFGSLKQTVVWKYEEDFSNLPSNVHVIKWASQQSILAHPNCVLFISHGGLLSMTESIHFAVPVIGVPAVADQFINVMRAEKKGFTKKVDLSINLAEKLDAAIKEVLGNPRYKEKVKELSFVYHNRLTDPRKELVHWVEHVIQTRGAPVLRSPALLVPFYQKYYLDLALVLLLIIIVLRKIFRYILAKLVAKTKNNVSEKKNR